MDKRVCTKCRRNRRMTTDFDHGWCNHCIIDLKLKNIQLEGAIEKALKLIGGHQHSKTICKAIVILQKELEGKDG